MWFLFFSISTTQIITGLFESKRDSKRPVKMAILAILSAVTHARYTYRGERKIKEGKISIFLFVEKSFYQRVLSLR
jgi:dipeptide/tripeptide permease